MLSRLVSTTLGRKGKEGMLPETFLRYKVIYSPLLDRLLECLMLELPEGKRRGRLLAGGTDQTSSEYTEQIRTTGSIKTIFTTWLRN